MKKISLLLMALAVGIATLSAQKKEPEFVKYMHSPWVDEVYNSMTLKEQIAQMIFVRVSPTVPSTVIEATKQVQDLKVGGVVVFKSTLSDQAQIVNGIQAQSKVPLLVAIDGEWGLGMRFTDVDNFPYQMALGSLSNNDYIYQMGREVARQAKRSGIHINLAPTIDVNNNAQNPVIGFRSFGEDPKDVAAKGLAYMKGMEDGGIICTAKHYPGHGDTAVDSHADLPLIAHDRARLDAVELLPFKEVIENGATGIMTAHLNVPALTGDNTPTSLSAKAVKELVRDEWGFKGLIITDGMEMKGITKYYGSGASARMAVQAGNDILELLGDPAEGIDSIYMGIEKGLIDRKQVEESVRRILAAKYYVGLNKYKPTRTWGMAADVNTPENDLLIRNMTESSLTCLKNDGVLPLPTQKYKKIAILSLRTSESSTFASRFKQYLKADYFTFNYKSGVGKYEDLLDSLKKYDLVIAEMGNFNSRTPGRAQKSDDEKANLILQWGATTHLQKILERLNAEHETIMAVFGMPYVMNSLPQLKDANAVLYSQGDNTLSRDLMAQAIAGAFDITGKLPVNTDLFAMGTSVKVKGGIRFKFTIGEEVGIDSRRLEHDIDSIVMGSIRNGAFPGCQLIIAKDQKIIYNRSFGYHDFTAQDRVEDNDLYDIASCTKVTTALPVYMQLYDTEKVNLDEPLSTYLPKLKFEKSNKASATLRSQLSHIAGFQPYHPFWSIAKKKGWLSDSPSSKYTIQVSQDMWAHKKSADMIYKKIRDLSLTEENKMKYSCLGFVLAPKIIENITGENFWDYLDHTIYEPLGLQHTTYNPLTRGGYQESDIAPTEVDDAFRKQLVRGFVHDEASAMMGGYSCNAGLFSNAMGVATIFQMYLNKGTYGGERIFSEETFDTFNKQYYLEHNNYRAIGFEKATPANKNRTVVKAWPAPSCSPSAFGHSGFTGTYAWADPENGLVYVFLSNRVYPTRNNKAFDKLQARVGIHELAYELLRQGLKSQPKKVEKENPDANKLLDIMAN